MPTPSAVRSSHPVQCTAQGTATQSSSSHFPDVPEASSPDGLSALCSKLPGLATSACLLASPRLPLATSSAEAALTLQVAQLWLARCQAQAEERARAGYLGPVIPHPLFCTPPFHKDLGLSTEVPWPRKAFVPQISTYTSHSIFKLLSRGTLPVPKTPGLTRSAGPGSLSSGCICPCVP